MSARACRAGIALHKLARIYERRGEAEEAARCYEENLASIDAERLAGSDTLDALLFLAAYKKARAAALGGRGAQGGGLLGCIASCSEVGVDASCLACERRRC